MVKLIIWIKPFGKYLFVIWLITIIIVSSIPSIPTLKIHTARTEVRLDYLIHFCEYGILAFLSFLSFASKDFKLSYKKFILITLSLILFAIMDEYHQKIIPGRSFNIMDILSNVSGIVVSVGFCILLFRMIVKTITKYD